MITGELKSKPDKVWDTFWAGGISNPLEVPIGRLLPRKVQALGDV